MQEFKALIELLTMLVMDPRNSVLFALLIVASVSDYRTYKIPNWLTGGGLLFGLAYSAVVPFSMQHGFLWALGGMLVGFLMMVPMYALRVMGAGDVKLMAMVGTFLGVQDTFYAVIVTFIVGGVAALGFGLFNKALGRMLTNVRSVGQVMVLSMIGRFRPDARISAGASAGKLPYGISIGVGTIGYVTAKHLGFM
jgi:prepilin peptidase CpaA